MSPMALLFLTLFNSMLGLSLLFPIIAPLGRELGLSEFQVGTFSTAYALMQFLLAPYWGRLSERRGRKPILLMGILGFSISFFAFALAAQLGFSGSIGSGWVYWLMLAARLFGGAFSSATLPTAQAYVADVTGSADRTAGMAVIGAAFGLGVVFGPAIGGALAGISLLVPVYFSATLALFNALFVWLTLPEPERHVHFKQPPRLNFWDMRVLPLLVVALAISLTSVTMETTVAFSFQDRLGLSAKGTAKAVSIALVIYGLVAVFVQGFLIRKYKWPALGMIRSGIPIAVAGFLTFVFGGGFSWLALALVLQGIGQGLAAPAVTAALSLAVGEGLQGAVAGLNSSAQGLGRMLGPLVGTWLYQNVSHTSPYVFSAGLLVFAWVLVMWGRASRVCAG
jgi:MFS family permease